MLLHRQQSSYYDALLGRQPSTKTLQLALVDDTADFNVNSKRVLAIQAPRMSLPKHGGDGFLLALKDHDRTEGDPEELEEANGAEQLKALVDKKKSHKWGPFMFHFVERPRKSGPKRGEMTYQLQVTCKQVS